jgi:glycosyltransferase involved in cell wall biosynthesis
MGFMSIDVPRVSVIMASYDSVVSLPVAIASVLQQSIADIELIVVDDASTDMTSSVVAGLAATDNRIQYIRLSQNSGPAAARNAGLNAALGVWIAPVDADDEIGHDRLRTLCAAGEAQSADMIADGVTFIGPGWPGRPFELPHLSKADGILKELSIEALIRSDIPLNGSCSLGYLKPLMRREFLQRFDLQYDEALRFAEDFNLYARALHCGAKLLLHPESHYRYIQTPLSASRSRDSFPQLAQYALLGNQKLLELDLDNLAGRPGLKPLLLSHRLRWSLVLWLNHLKTALRAREFGGATRLLLHCPGGWLDMVSFAIDRIRANAKREKVAPKPRTTIEKHFDYRR